MLLIIKVIVFVTYMLLSGIVLMRYNNAYCQEELTGTELVRMYRHWFNSTAMVLLIVCYPVNILVLAGMILVNVIIYKVDESLFTDEVSKLTDAITIFLMVGFAVML